MNKFALLSAGLAALLIALLPAAPALALNFKSFVSSAGGGTICTLTSPCADFQTAHDATQEGGEISCLNSGLFGGAIINKSITINCAGTSASVGDFSVNKAGVVVRLRNLLFDGVSNTGTDIDFINGAALFVQNCVIEHFSLAGTAGIRFAPTAAAKLVVTDSVIANNGSGTTGGGIVIAPASGIAALVTIDRVKVANNSHGIVANGTGGGAIRGVVSDSVVSGNVNNGITVAASGAGSAVLTIQNTKVVGNNFGLVAGGSNAGMLVGQSNISINSTGLFSASGGVLYSYGNNSVNGNPAGETFSTTLPQK